MADSASEPNSKYNPDTDAVQHWLTLHAAGDVQARQKLLELTMQRLETLARRMLSDIGWLRTREETGDVLQNSTIRLWRALDDQKPAATIDYFRLAACIIRRELIDMFRHHFRGGQHLTYGLNSPLSENPDSVPQQLMEPGNQSLNETWDPARISRWTDFHDYVERLPEQERVLFDLLWYQELPMAAASELLNIPMRTLGRRWKAARVTLYRSLFGTDVPDDAEQ